MPVERYLGYHFTQTAVLIAEAFHSRDDRLQWEIFKQPNYELPPEWLALYKEAIPNLYDTQQQVFGFQALPAIWSGLTKGRFHRYDSDFFRSLAKGTADKSTLAELTRFLKYSLVYHIKPQPDEHLYITLVLEDLVDEDLTGSLKALQRGITMPNLSFVSTVSPQEAVLHYLYYRSLGTEPIDDKTILVIDAGYIYTEFTHWINGAPEAPVRAQGMRHLDMGVCDYLQTKHESARSLDLADLVIYAQRARTDYEPGQNLVPIFQPSSAGWIEMSEQEYLTLIQPSADDIAKRLHRALKSRTDPIHQIIITGEGAEFKPVLNPLLNILKALNLPDPIVLSHSSVSCAQGAAGLSYEVQHSTREAQ